MGELIKTNNELVKNNNSVRLSFLDGKRKWFSKMYIKSNKIDTIIHDLDHSLSICSNIYENTNIKNVIYDLDKINYDIDCTLKWDHIENISFLEYPMLEGVTIPIDILKKINRIKVDGIAYCRGIKKINILINNEIKTYDVNDTYKYFEIEINSKIVLKLVKDFNDFNKLNKRYITIDESGIVSDYYPYYYYNDSKLDLKDHLDKRIIIFDEDLDSLDEFIIDTKYLKNIKLKEVGEFRVNKLKIIDSDDMKLIPNDMEFENVKITISKDNKAILIEDMHGTITYTYFDDNNKINIIKDKKVLEYCDFNFTEKLIGVMFKKDNLVYEIFINNNSYIIDKEFIEWVIKDESNHLKTFIYDCITENYVDYEDLDNKIENQLLGEILYVLGARQFNNLYMDYKKSINHIEYLKSRGFTNEAIEYLIENNYNNILGINQEFKESYINCDIIETFNEVGKKLVKRRD